MRIKSWFLYKNFDQLERYQIECAIGTDELKIIKETAKAYYFAATSDFGTFRFWCPKSCVIDDTLPIDNTVITRATTKDGRTLDVISDDGYIVALSDGKKYAKFTLTY